MFELLKTTTGCGINDFCDDVGVKTTFRFVGYGLFFLKIILPLLIIIIASINLGKTVLGGDEEAIRDTSMQLIKKIFSALLIFFIPTILGLVVDSFSDYSKVKKCATCLFEPFDCNDLDSPTKCEKLVKSISISNCSKGSLSINQNGSKSLYLKYDPSDADNTGVSYASSNKKIVTVDSSGNVKGKTIGSATVTVNLKDDKNIKATCKINVKKGSSSGSSSGGNGKQTGTFAWPVPSSKNICYWTACYGGHHGNDITANTGADVLAVDGGIVEKIATGCSTGYIGSNCNDGWGNYVLIKHDSRWSTQYNHLSKITVKKGSKVSQGQKIGEVGSTGNSSGPHLDIECRDTKSNSDSCSTCHRVSCQGKIVYGKKTKYK